MININLIRIKLETVSYHLFLIILLFRDYQVFACLYVEFEA